MNKREWGISFCVIVVAMIPGFFALTFQSLWFDEVASVLFASRPSLSSVLEFTSKDFHPPLYYYLLSIWLWLSDSTDFAARLFSACIGALSLLLFFLSMRRHLGVRAARIGVLISGLSLTHLFFSQEVRPYIMVYCLSVNTLDLYLVLWKQRTLKKLTSFVFGCLNGLLVLTHYISLLSFFCMCVVLLGRILCEKSQRGNYAAIGLIVIGTSLFTIPLAFVLPQQFVQATTHFWMTTPDFLNLFVIWPSLLFYLRPIRYSALFDWFPVFTALCLTGVIVSSASQDSSCTRSRPSSIVVPLCLVVCGIPTLTWIISVLVLPVLSLKTCIGVAPAVVFLMVALLEMLISKSRISYLFLYVIFVCEASQIPWYFSRHHKENWRDAASFVSAHAKPGDRVYFKSPWVSLAFNRYYSGPDLSVVFDPHELSDGRGWLILSQTTDSLQKITHEIEPAQDHRLLRKKRFTGIRIGLLSPNEGM